MIKDKNESDDSKEAEEIALLCGEGVCNKKTYTDQTIIFTEK
jgi:hypothetical protein